MGRTAAAIAVALVAAVLFGLASALQHEQAQAVARSGSPGLLVALARRPRWLAGTACDTLAIALQALALGLGTVALVQPLLVAGLPVAVALSALLEHRRLLRREVVGVLLSTGGLALIGPATATTSAGDAPSRAVGLVAAVLVAAVTAALLLTARRTPRWSAGAAGVAAGLATGSGSVLLSVAASRIGDIRLLALSVAPYAAVVVGLLGLLLAQSAFQTGALGAPLAALSVTEPVVAVLLAVAVLHERLPTTAAARGALAVGTALAVVGVGVLCRPAPHPADRLPAG